MSNRTIAGLAAAVAVAGTMTVATATTNAAPAAPACATATMCLFEDNHYRGARLAFPGGVPRGRCAPLTRAADSAVNNAGTDQHVYSDANCLGVRLRLCANGCAVPDITRVLGRPALSVSG